MCTLQGSAAVVIPTWNGRALLATCLPALYAQTRRPDEVVIVDNGSGDGTAEWLVAEFPDVRVVRNEHNAGFAAAVNQGILATTSLWVAPLNNDAVPAQDWLLQLLMVGDTDPRIGAVASRMMFQQAPDVVNSAGIRMDRSASGVDLHMGERRWSSEPVEVFGASAGACLYRRQALDDVGPFEESYFAYLEDVDLAWRLQLRSWRAMLAPDAVVSHAFSATGGAGSPWKRYLMARNKWRTIIREYPWPQLLRDFPLILGRDALFVGYAIAERDRASLRGRLDALRELPGLLRARREIQARRTASWDDIARVLSPLESPLTIYRRVKLVEAIAGRKAI